MQRDNDYKKAEYEKLKQQYFNNSKDTAIAEQFAVVCFDLKKYKESEKIYKVLIDLQPETSKYNYRLGKVYFALENFTDALTQQIIAVEKWDGFNWAKLEKVKCLIKLNRIDEVGQLIDDLETNINDKEKDALLFKNILKLKIEFLESSKLFSEALDYCKRLIELDKTDGFSHYNCGKINLELKKYEDALLNFKSADDLLKQPYVKDKIATTLAYLDRKLEAIEVYKQIPSHRMDDYLLQHFGRLYFSIDDFDNAKIKLKQAIIKNGKSIAKSHYYLGLVYEKLKLYRNALSEFNKAQQYKRKLYKSDYFEALEKVDFINKNITLEENEKIEAYVMERELADSNELQGKIEKYFEDRGFGFIRDSANNKYFFHIKNCKIINPKIEDKVSYILIDGKKGKEAINVNRVKN